MKIDNTMAKAIKNEEKRILITNKSYKVNEVIELQNEDLGIVYCKVLEVNHYSSREELINEEGQRYTLKLSNGLYAVHIMYLYSENTIWEELYEKANNVRNSRDISGMISAGAVGAAILTKDHNIYTGVCIDTASSLGMCGERNAIANMITNGENEIDKLLCIDSTGNVGYPCGACREYLMQLSKNSKNIEIIKDMNTKETIRLEELVPGWWGYDRV